MRIQDTHGSRCGTPTSRRRHHPGRALGRLGIAAVAAAAALLTPCGDPPAPPRALRFADATRAAGLERTTPTYAVAAADVDADGAVDLFVSNHREPAALYRNQGDGTFQESGTFAPGDLHGASWLDWNDDGRLDLFVAVGANRGTALKANRMYLQDDRGRLVLVDPGEPVTDPHGRGRSGCPVDPDGDGRIELLLLNGRPGQPGRLAVRRDGTADDRGRRVGVGRLDGVAVAALRLASGEPPVLITDTLRAYRLADDGRFADVTATLGLPRLDFVQAVAVGDYDNDGDLDLFAVRGWMEPGGALSDGGLAFQLPFRKRGYAATRARARGDLTLELTDDPPDAPPATRPSLLHLGAGRRPVEALPWRGAWDAPELAGRPALDPRRDAGLFLWREADGTLVLAAVGLPQPGGVRGRLTASGGVEVAETLEIDPRPHDLRSRLFQNRGRAFADVTDRAGITTEGHGRDAVFADLDDDGDLDLFVVTGGQRGRNPPDVLYRNDGDGTFTDVTAASGMAGPSEGTGNAVVAFDYDRDGRIDLFTANGYGPPPFDRGPYWLTRNESEHGNSVEVSLVGRAGNRAALGARVWAETQGRVLGMERHACTGPRGTSVLPLHVGLGLADTTNLVVTWPSGRESRHTLRAGERVSLVEPGGAG